MEVRPKLEIKLTTIDKVFEILALLMLMILWLLTVLNYLSLPDNIPTRINTDNSGSKDVIFFLPIFVTILYAGLTKINKYPHIFNYPKEITYANALAQYTNATQLTRYLKFIMLFIFTFFQFMDLNAASGKPSEHAAWVTPFLLGLMFVLIFLPMVYCVIKAFKI